MARKKKTFTEEELKNPRTAEQFQLALKRKTMMFYDIQRLRLQTQGRLTKKSPTNPIELHASDLAKLQSRVVDLEKAEHNALGDLEDQLNEVPFYVDVILPKRGDQYKGLGPRMASVILSSFDIVREENPSQIWSFAGLAPLPAKRCKGCQWVVEEKNGVLKHPVHGGQRDGNKTIKCVFNNANFGVEHTFDSGKQMRPVPGEKLRYNAWLRSKLCGVLGTVLLQVGSPYRKVYDDYKHRKASEGWGKSDAHRHQAAIRRMIKQLLLDIWTDWRTYLKLPVRPSYQEEKLGHTYSGTPIRELPAKAAVETPAHADPLEIVDEDPSFQAEIDAEIAAQQAS